MKWDANRFGRGSAVGDSAALRDAWSKVGTLPEGEAPGEWVPWMAVWIKDGVSPRAVTSETVDRYAEAFAPIMSRSPIKVQKGTFALIDGRHRLESAPKALSDFVRIVEVDVSDDDLPLVAFEANLGHGLPYTLSERVTGAKLLLRRYPDMKAVDLAQKTGLSYDSAMKYRRQILGLNNEPNPAENEYRKPSFSEAQPDNNKSPQKPTSTPARSTVKTFEPDIDPPIPDDDWGEEVDPNEQVEALGGGWHEDGDGSSDAGLAPSSAAPIKSEVDATVTAPVAPSVPEGEAHLGMGALPEPVIGEDSWDRFKVRQTAPNNDGEHPLAAKSYMWIKGLSDEGRLYLTVLETAAMTPDDVVREVWEKAEKDLARHFGTLTEHRNMRVKA